MINYFEILIALRYLRSKKKDTIISVIAGFSLVGVALGVAALIVVMGVMNGFHHEISAKMTGFNGDITIKSNLGSIENYQQLVNKVAHHQGVKSAIPMIEGQVMASSNNYSSGALVKGIRSQDLVHKPIVANNIILGNTHNFNEDHLLIGYRLGYNLGLASVNNQLTLISPKGSYTAIGMIPRIKTFKVGGLFQSDMYLYDETSIFMELSMAQVYFKLQDRITVIEVMLENRDISEIVAKELDEFLNHEYIISDWKTSNASYFNVLKTERVVMFMILTLIILVAAFNIISSLIMLVKDKSKDIAILKTMGATANSIMRIFFFCGLSVGVIGTFLGTILGLAFALNIESIRIFLEKFSGSKIFDPIVYYLSALPCSLDSNEVLQIVILSISLSVLATIYPAYKAARQSPIEVLRYE